MASAKKRPRVYLDIDIGDPEAHARDAAAHARFLAFWSDQGVKIYGAPPPPAALDAALKETLLESYGADPAASAAGEARADAPASLRAGRLVLELFSDESPKAVANFLALLGGKVVSKAQKRPLSYRSNRFHRVVKGFVAQAGVMNRLGTGESSFPGNGPFQDDKGGLKLKHDAAGTLSMANGGKAHTNTSQFFLALGPAAPALDGKHVVFGRVVGAEGLALLRRIDEEAGAPDGQPPRAVVSIGDCGELAETE
jgi:cyclophilin family peptidyl-prolyl cis-trans isomerase